MIKGLKRIKESGKALKELGKAVVSTAKTKVKRYDIAMRMADEIAPAGITGEKNYNIHTRTIQRMLKKNDSAGALAYISKQRAKVHAQQSVAKIKVK